VFKGLDIHVGRTYQDLSLRRFEHIPPGGNRTNIPEDLLYDCWKRHATGAMDVMGRLRWDEPAVTIRTEFFKPDKGRYLHPQWDREVQVNRALTHLEAARLQSFKDDFLWCGRKLEIARQIGNAVPPQLAQAVGTHILPRLA
jgi:DNA (cytosine-5)-methyltransferase 1